MPHCSVSRDLKAHIPILHYEQGLSGKKICELLGVKKSLAYQTLTLMACITTLIPTMWVNNAPYSQLISTSSTIFYNNVTVHI